MARFFERKQGRKRAIAALSFALAATLSLGALSACGTTDSTEEEEETTSSRRDTQLIKNGDFEYYNDYEVEELSEKRDLINSPNDWSRTTGSDSNGSAPVSDAASGIVNTDAAEWNNFTRPGRPFTSVEDALAHWEDEDVTAYDRLKFYDEFDIESVDDFEYYDDYTFSVDYDDVKNFYDEEASEALVENPGTHGETEGTSVLMIQNQKITNSTVYGTAQYYTSGSTVTLSAGTAAEVSVWVKTSNLTHYEDQPADGRCGAYIGVINTVGGTTLDQMQIKNINTETLNPDGENNGWVQYTLYVRASTFASSTFKIVLGLGMGSSTDMYETVNGYAFFDDLTCKIISSDDYETATETLGENVTCTVNDYDADKKFDTARSDDRTFALDLYAGFERFDLTASGTSVSIDLTKEIYGDREYTSETYKNIGLSKDAKSYTELATLGALKTAAESNSVLQSVISRDFENFPFGGDDKDDEQIVMLMSNNGAPYTATVRSDKFTIAPDGQILLSFFVKTSDMQSFTGAGATIVDGTTKTAISGVDSTVLVTTDIDEDRKDIYDGWAQCFFYVSNDTDEEKTFYLELTYGLTTIVGTTKDSYTDGYAAFANFETYDISDREIGYASTGDRAKTVSLTSETASGTKFDDVVYNDPDSVEDDIANPANYWGLRGGDKRVGGDEAFTPNTTPDSVYAGLVNADHADNYADAAWKTELCNIAKQAGILNDALSADWWSRIFGTAKQPLVIINKIQSGDLADRMEAYGYIARATATISSSTYQRVSVRVKVSEGAKAYIYLIDASDLEKGYYDCLSLDMPVYTYWYDDDGNVAAIDPEDDEFEEETDLVYLLEDNGLYTNARDESDTKYYANLSNYEKDEDGNLVTGTDEDGQIAFYAHDGKFYAYCDEETQEYSTEVVDFDHSFARYDYSADEKTSHQSLIIVDGTKPGVANKWVNVCFYIHTGNTAKDYRLEVWSGSRDGEVVNPAGSYVIFDENTSASAASDYETLLDEAVSDLKDELGLGEEEDLPADVALYYTYTFYDDPSYLRYDETQDEENAGNPYASYTQSTYEETIAYLYREDDTASSTELSYQLFLDYSATEVTVEADETEDTDDSTTEDEAAEPEYNVWLLVASGAMVVALVIVLISMAIRKIAKRRRSKAAVHGKSVYGGKQKKAKTPAEQPESKPEAPKDENDPYNE